MCDSCINKDVITELARPNLYVDMELKHILSDYCRLESLTSNLPNNYHKETLIIYAVLTRILIPCFVLCYCAALTIVHVV